MAMLLVLILPKPSLLSSRRVGLSKFNPFTLKTLQFSPLPSWNTTSETVSQFAYGSHEGAVIPTYIAQVVFSLEDVCWKTFWATRLIIKHNHRVVANQIKKEQKGNLTRLLNLQG